MSDGYDGRATLQCPECDYSVEYDPETNASRIRAKVDAGVHWEREHGGLVPDEAEFGEQQCPECHEMLGFNGTRSCSECGFIPARYRDD